MTETTRSGGTGVGAVLGVLGLVAAVSVGAIALGSGTPAGATGLEQFDSCAELREWTGEVQPTETTFASDGDDALDRDMALTDEGAPVPSAAPASPGEGAGTGPAESAEDSAAAGQAAAGDTGGTNTVVEGVDEIDIIDRVGDDRLLVSRNGALALVDLSGRTTVAELEGLPWDARVSVADDLVWVAGTSNDGLGTEVRRVRLDGDAFVEDGSWSTPGYLIDARRTGDQLHLVAVDHQQPGVVPFEGGPVPCDEVWRPVDPASTPAATLVASLPASGALEPTAAAEITGSAGNLLVTSGAVYVATESWDEAGTVTTGLHRFDLADLAPTGSGEVPGSVAGRFALNEHEGTLRVATNAGSGFGFGRAIPVEGDVIIDDAPVVATEEGPGSLAEVFTFDTDGDLDLLGRTGLFGHDGETIHGVRFIGDIAYVVTFLQTDPFWVIDLADPAAPAVVGELEIPGFSGYLHPAGDGRVVGFGPDGNGAIAVRLFDVTDPSAPSVIDEIALGHDSPVAYDHHAFVGLGEGRFAVPFTDYPEYREVTDCDQPIPLPQPIEPIPVDPGIGDGSSGSGSTGTVDPGITTEQPPVFYCEPVAVGGETGAVVLEVVDGRLSVAERASVPSAEVYAERIVADPEGNWLLLSWDRLVATDDGTEIVLPAGNTGGIVID